MSTLEATPNALQHRDPRRLKAIGNMLRIHSIRSTTAAGSGHPTSSMSAADLMAALFFGGIMNYDPHNPQDPRLDRFILSKGHAAPVLYAAWAEAGYISLDHLTTLRQLDSNLEGHPTRHLPFVDVATGSLGQGLSAGVGQAIAARIDGLDARTYVLMGDGEIMEGSVWEAAALAAIEKLDHLIGIVDVNALGQSAPTAYEHQMDIYRRKWEAFGWNALVFDGHNMEEVLQAYDTALNTKEKPTVLLARTEKGAGVSFLSGMEGWHGKALPAEDAEKAIAELEPNAQHALDTDLQRKESLHDPDTMPANPRPQPDTKPVRYEKGKEVATREAFGVALQRLGGKIPDLVVLDGDTQNSTYTDKFHKSYPDRFVQCYIAEQNMVGVAAGLSTRGKIPMASTFACFLTRAFDQIRMAGLSEANLKLCGSHAGVSIGEDGASQMGLEDLSMMRSVLDSVVLYPSDAVSAEKLTELLLCHCGIGYIRTSRPKTPVIYDADEEFQLGGSKVVRRSDDDVATVVGAGVTLFEALKAAEALEKNGVKIQVIDAYSIKPIDREGLLAAARRTGDTLITVEDHWMEGGLGDAVAGELSREGVKVHKLAVTGLPHSGQPEELLERHGISSECIAKKVEELLG
ncbi:MAG: transketolase [Armatimonadetes bacterium]|nr:transketolase [Armatimonadota bacterium]